MRKQLHAYDIWTGQSLTKYGACTNSRYSNIFTNTGDNNDVSLYRTETRLQMFFESRLVRGI